MYLECNSMGTLRRSALPLAYLQQEKRMRRQRFSNCKNGCQENVTVTDFKGFGEIARKPEELLRHMMERWGPGGSQISES